MTPCNYLDKGITAADPDRALADAHVVGCATCQDAIAQMAWIGAAVPRLAAAWEPREGWESRVLAGVRREIVPPRRSRWWVAAVPALAMAAAIVLFVRPRSAAELALTYQVEKAQVRRGDARGSAAVGDTIRVTASGDAAHRALWVFRDGRTLVLACPGAPACRDGGALEATFVPAVIGTYELVLLASPTPIPAPSDSFDESVAGAIRAGATPRHQVIDVR
jgi:hypothetical protein